MSAPTAISADVRTSAQQVGFVGVENIVKRFVTPEGTVCAVDDVSFSIHGGQLVALLGPNGAGKTTTVSMVAGLLTPDRGEVLVADASQDIAAPATMRRRVTLTRTATVVEDGPSVHSAFPVDVVAEPSARAAVDHAIAAGKPRESA